MSSTSMRSSPCSDPETVFKGLEVNVAALEETLRELEGEATGIISALVGTPFLPGSCKKFHSGVRGEIQGKAPPHVLGRLVMAMARCSSHVALTREVLRALHFVESSSSSSSS